MSSSGREHEASVWRLLAFLERHDPRARVRAELRRLRELAEREVGRWRS